MRNVINIAQGIEKERKAMLSPFQSWSDIFVKHDLVFITYKSVYDMKNNFFGETFTFRRKNFDFLKKIKKRGAKCKKLL